MCKNTNPQNQTNTQPHKHPGTHRVLDVEAHGADAEARRVGAENDGAGVHDVADERLLLHRQAAREEDPAAPARPYAPQVQHDAAEVLQAEVHLVHEEPVQGLEVRELLVQEAAEGVRRGHVGAHQQEARLWRVHPPMKLLLALRGPAHHLQTCSPRARLEPRDHHVLGRHHHRELLVVVQGRHDGDAGLAAACGVLWQGGWYVRVSATRWSDGLTNIPSTTNHL